LWRSAAVAVGEAGLDSGHVVLGELSIGGDGGGVIDDALAVEADPVLAVLPSASLRMICSGECRRCFFIPMGFIVLPAALDGPIALFVLAALRAIVGQAEPFVPWLFTTGRSFQLLLNAPQVDQRSILDLSAAEGRGRRSTDQLPQHPDSRRACQYAVHDVCHRVVSTLEP